MNKKFLNFFISKKDKNALMRIKSYEDIKKTNQDYSRIVVKKPWGYEYLLFSNRYFAMTILYLKYGEQTSLHCHPNKTTALFVLSGSITFYTLNSKDKIDYGSGCYIDKKVFHRSKSTSEEGTFLLEIETPVNKQDLIRLKDSYGRKGKGYEKNDSFAFNTNNYNYLSFKKTKNENDLKKFFGNISLTLKLFNNTSITSSNYNKDNLFMILSNVNRISKNYNFSKFLNYNDFKKIIRQNNLKKFNYLLINKTDSIIKVTDYIAKFFVNKNQKEIFVTPGSQNLHIIDSLGRSENINLISSYNPNTISKAAEGYSIAHKKISVVIVSSGSSSTEIFPSISNSWIESIPVIYIIGQAIFNSKKVRQFGIKEFKLSENIKKITKHSAIIKNELSIKYHLEKAYNLSLEGRPGPSVLEIPINIQSKNIHEDTLLNFFPIKNDKMKYNNNLLINDIKKMISLINKSKRPAIIIGNGIKISSSEILVKSFLNDLNIPVLLTQKAPDLLAFNDKNNYGTPGPFGQRSSNYIIQNCDLLISFGCRLGQTVTGRATKLFARNAKVLAVDCDLNELNKKNIDINYKLNHDLKSFLEIGIKFKRQINPKISNWLKFCKNIKNKFNGEFYYYKSGKKIKENKKEILPLNLIRDISKYCKSNSIIIADNFGPHLYLTLSFRFKKNQTLICSPSLETRGFSIPAALGASINQTNIICLTEIAGFQKNIYDLEFIKKYNINLKILLMIKDDNYILKVSQKKFFGERFITTDYSNKYNFNSLFNICKYFDIKVFKLFNYKNYNKTINNFFKEKKSSLLAVKIKDDQDIISKQGFYINKKNEWIPKPLEDMDPYFDRVVLKKNMLIDIVKYEK